MSSASCASGGARRGGGGGLVVSIPLASLGASLAWNFIRIRRCVVIAR